MPNAETWTASKAVLRNGTWRASRDTKVVLRSSRITADVLIANYARLLEAHARGVLVDLGCGQAPYFGMYRGLVTQSIGVDWGQSLHGADQVDVQCDLNGDLTIPDSFADTVLCTDVFEHIFNPSHLWREISRILKPSGSAIIGIPFFYRIHEEPHDYHRYTRFALRRYMEDAGLSVKFIDSVGGLGYVMADLVCRATDRARLTRLAEPLCQSALKLLAPRKPNPDTAYPLAYVAVATKDVEMHAHNFDGARPSAVAGTPHGQ